MKFVATLAVLMLAAGAAQAAPAGSDEAATFVQRYTAAWSARDPDALAALWDREGVLIDPLYDRNVRGDEIAALTRGQLARNPDLSWKLERWAARGNGVALEFSNTFTIGGKLFEWRGVDWMVLKNGRILEERVYVDTASLRALRDGRPMEALARLPADLNAKTGGRP